MVTETITELIDDKWIMQRTGVEDKTPEILVFHQNLKTRMILKMQW